jgi:predicted CopG family antitoxin
MSKRVVVTDQVYARLEALQKPRETFSQVIERCISTVEALLGVAPIIEGGIAYEAFKRAREANTERAIRPGDSPPMPKLPIH